MIPAGHRTLNSPRRSLSLSKLVVCTDGGLSSYENRKNDSAGDRSFVTVQSLKKLKGYLQEWALDCKGWRTAGSDKEYDISTLDQSLIHIRRCRR